MLRLTQDWVRIYCGKAQEAEALKKDWRMMIPIYVRAFRNMIREGVKSIPCIEFVLSDSHTPTYLTVNWSEMEAILDGCIAKLELLEDYEECQELIDLKRHIQEAEVAIC
jgi:hypothetical protein